MTTQFEILAIQAMHTEAVAMYLKAKHDPSISLDHHTGAATAIYKVLRLLAPESITVSLSESLALVQAVETKSTATYDLINMTASVPLSETV